MIEVRKIKQIKKRVEIQILFIDIYKKKIIYIMMKIVTNFWTLLSNVDFVFFQFIIKLFQIFIVIVLGRGFIRTRFIIRWVTLIWTFIVIIIIYWIIVCLFADIIYSWRCWRRAFIILWTKVFVGSGQSRQFFGRWWMARFTFGSNRVFC